MKRIFGMVIMLNIGVCQSGHGYQRFTYIDYHFTLSEQDARTLLDDLVYHNVTNNKKSVSYSVQYTPSRRDFVYLSRVDKWRIARVLRLYDPTLLLTPGIIDHIVASLAGKRKIIIQHVLHDFLKNANSTIESILQVLQSNTIS